MDDEFVKEIKELLALGYEGGYWDFKKEYTPFADDKLTDIICMANNLCNRDRKSTRLNSSHRSQSRMPSSA